MASETATGIAAPSRPRGNASKSEASLAAGFHRNRTRIRAVRQRDVPIVKPLTEPHGTDVSFELMRGEEAGNCFEFYIDRNINSTKQLPVEDWSHVQVLSGPDNVTAEVQIPITMSYSGVIIFFANDAKEILGVHLNNETVGGKFYSKPHKLVKEMESEEPPTVETSFGYHLLSAAFPRSWLPGNFSKISGSVSSTDGRCYNYYGVQNLDIGIQDLMVLEEFKELPRE